MWGKWLCVDDEGLPGPEELIGACPKEGGVYTVRALGPWEDTVALLLAELENPFFEWIDGNEGEISFRAFRFRPAKTTSLEVFEELLAPDLETAWRGKPRAYDEPKPPSPKELALHLAIADHLRDVSLDLSR
jgi:hypothetical protein